MSIIYIDKYLLLKLNLQIKEGKNVLTTYMSYLYIVNFTFFVV